MSKQIKGYFVYPDGELSFGFYSLEGGTTGEMSVKWESLCGKSTPVISVYSDAWKALANMQDLLVVLAKYDSKNPGLQEFCKYLREGGFVDMRKERAKNGILLDRI